MDRQKLRDALSELLRRTDAGEVEWSSAGRDTIKTKIDNLRVIVSSEGRVKLVKVKRLSEPPFKTQQSRFSFQDERGREIYMAATTEDPPEPARMFADKMLG